MRIGTSEFKGERPKRDPSNLNDNDAQLAIDCELTSTGIRALRSNTTVQNLDTVAQTLYNFEDRWFSWDTPTEVIESPTGIATRRMFYTNDTGARQLEVLDSGSVRDTAMGIPVPNPPLIESRRDYTVDPDIPLSEADKEVEYLADVFWVTSFVNIWGEEGDKSLPSETIYVAYNLDITLNNLVGGNNALIRFNNYSIVAVRLYRFFQGESRFVAEIPYNDTTVQTENTEFVDIHTNELGEIFSSEDYIAPPEGLRGLHLAANGIAYGFEGSMVYVSVPGNLNAWPYFFPVQSNVVGISSFDNTVVVLTEGYPELATVFDPSEIVPYILTERYPCVSAQSIVQMLGGVVYASSSGLVHIGAAGASLITTEHYGEREWQALQPDTFNAVTRDGEYYAWHGESDSAQGRCFVFDTRETAQFVRQMSAFYNAAYVLRGTDKLYVANGDSLELLGSGNERIPYRWRSKRHGVGSPVAMTCAQVHGFIFDAPGDGLSVSVIADGVVIDQNEVTDEEPYRLSYADRARHWEYELIGTVDVTQFAIAGSQSELHVGS